MTVYRDGEAQINFLLSLSGDVEPMSVTMGVHAGDGPDGGELGFINDSFADNVLPLISDEYVYFGVRVRGATTASVQYEAEAFVAEPGGASGAFLPQNCALLVKKRTGFAGHANRGRMYVPGILDETSVDERGAINSVALATYQAAFEAFLTDLTTTANTAITTALVLHPAADGTPIETLVCDSTIATQRRRLR